MTGRARSRQRTLAAALARRRRSRGSTTASSAPALTGQANAILLAPRLDPLEHRTLRIDDAGARAARTATPSGSTRSSSATSTRRTTSGSRRCRAAEIVRARGVRRVDGRRRAAARARRRLQPAREHLASWPAGRPADRHRPRRSSRGLAASPLDVWPDERRLHNGAVLSDHAPVEVTDRMTPDEARALFPVLERLAYLNAGTFGPLARPTRDAMQDAARRRPRRRPLRQGVLRADARPARAGAGALAGLVGAEPEQVALTGSTTDGCNIVLAGLDLGPEDEIVTTAEEHFGLLGPVHASGARVVVAEPDPDAILAAVTPRTRLLALSQVLWTSGRALPVRELREQTGVPVLVDGAQSVGAIPVDAAGLDFLTISGQKWLCGPDSTGALVVADPERLRVARPSYFSQTVLRAGGSFEPRRGRRALRSRLAPDARPRRPARRARRPARTGRYERAAEQARALPRAARAARRGRPRRRDARRRSAPRIRPALVARLAEAGRRRPRDPGDRASSASRAAGGRATTTCAPRGLIRVATETRLPWPPSTPEGQVRGLAGASSRCSRGVLATLLFVGSAQPAARASRSSSASRGPAEGDRRHVVTPAAQLGGSAFRLTTLWSPGQTTLAPTRP